MNTEIKDSLAQGIDPYNPISGKTDKVKKFGKDEHEALAASVYYNDRKAFMAGVRFGRDKT